MDWWNRSSNLNETMKNGKKSPPRIAKWIISRLSYYEKEHALADAIEADYFDIQARYGAILSWVWYWFCTFQTLFQYLKLSLLWSMIMFKNYLKIAFRCIKRRKIYSFINITGLAIGIAAAVLILLWVRDERSYDRFHANADRIYRAAQVFHYDEYHLEQANTPSILAPTILDECPEVELATRVRGYQDDYLVIADGKKFNESGLGIVDESFFRLFSFLVIEGNPGTILAGPQTVAISERAAEKYFGSSSAVGRTLTIFDEDFLVSGIFKTMPDNSHFHLDVLCSFASFERYHKPQWGMNVFKTYVLVREGSSIQALHEKLDDIVKNHMFDSEERYEATRAKGNYTKFPLRPLTDIHLRSHLLWEFEANGNATYVQFFTIIAVFILLIAVVNYTNLSTARSAGRAREVGIRKTVGSTRASLVRQFLIESILTSLMAMVLALIFIRILLPAFRQLVGKPWLKFQYIQNPLALPALVVLALLIGVIAGLYPSLFLSSFKPVAVLGGKFSQGLKNSILRNGLVVFQFSLSIVLLVGTLVVQKQMAFVQSQNLGYDRDQVVVLETFGELGQKLSALKETLLSDPSVVAVSASSSVPGTSFTNVGIRLEGRGRWLGTNLFIADQDFLDVMQLEMVEGRFFSKEFPTDRQAIILNESKVRALNEEDLLNKRIEGWVGGDQNYWFPVIGIVKDFHYESFHEPIKPLAMVMLNGVCPWSESYLSVRIKADNVRETIAQLRKSWGRIMPGTPFEFSFLDTIYDDQYRNEERTGRVFTIFTFFALFVACLGLLGLASFAAEQRTKEIGIRKVLGASIPGIILMMSREFTRWVLLANIIAWPIAYYLMNRWLQSFAYRSDIGLLVFIFSGFMALVIALLTVSFQAVKAATANPVDSLRYE
jgi:putative ABC transport system permease protein